MRAGMGPPGLEGYESSIQAQWTLRLLDFLSVSMVIPTMAQYFISAGGSDRDYYSALMGTTLVQMASNVLVGLAADHGASLKAMYVSLCLISILGAMLYATADVIPAIRMPPVILMARLLTGVGTGKTTLVFVFLGRLAKPAERQLWLIRLATSRSLGLFVGPALSVGLAALLSSGPDLGGSFLGLYALPGLFLGLSNMVATCWFLAAWRDVPPPASAQPRLERLTSASSIAPGPGDIFRFFRKGPVLAVVACSSLGQGTAAALEYVVPVAASQALKWGPGGGGAVLMAVSLAVLLNQLVVMRLTRFLEDRRFVVIGISGLSLTLLFFVVLWTFLLPLGPDATAAASAHGLLVMAPIVLSECWFPYLGSGTSATFTRLVVTYVPWRMGVCQALVNTNGPVMGQFFFTAWLQVSYSGAKVQEEGAPQTAFRGIVAVNLAILAGILRFYRQMEDRAPGPKRKNSMLVRKTSICEQSGPLTDEDLAEFRQEPLLGGGDKPEEGRGNIA